MSYIVIDDLLSPEKADEIEQLVQSDKMKWIEYPYGGAPKEFKWDDGIHYDDKQWAYHIDDNKYKYIVTHIEEQIQKHISDKELSSAKINKSQPPIGIEWSDNLYGGPHFDSTVPGLLTGIYYIHDVDGDTLLYNEVWDEDDFEEIGPESLTLQARISPKKNRLVLFNGHTYHSASVPSSGVRYVININWADPFIFDYENMLFVDTATGEKVKLC